MRMRDSLRLLGLIGIAIVILIGAYGYFFHPDLPLRWLLLFVLVFLGHLSDLLARKE
ncbi:hypothetical protein [Herpetosiphon sp. NSE202]|uniref:hypothetical protein n=1 Tax=Herpetosiphon sp. NSE202 TaxID=3351349 RepID=UPI0036389DCE